MALQTTTTIKIGDTIVKNFTHLEINQEIHDHHTFSIELRQDLLVGEFESNLPVSQNLSAEKVSIEIKPMSDLDLTDVENHNDYILHFYGVVTNVSMRKSRVHDMEETMIIEGYGLSILLDNGWQTNSFIEKPLLDIVNKVKSGYDITMKVNPFYKDNLAYTVQYNESDFDFLNRIAMRHGQWFYYNGTIMVFGTPGSNGKEPTLIYGVNMREFSYNIKVKPHII